MLQRVLRVLSPSVPLRRAMASAVPADAKFVCTDGDDCPVSERSARA